MIYHLTIIHECSEKFSQLVDKSINCQRNMSIIQEICGQPKKYFNNPRNLSNVKEIFHIIKNIYQWTKKSFKCIRNLSVTRKIYKWLQKSINHQGNLSTAKEIYYRPENLLIAEKSMDNLINLLFD